MADTDKKSPNKIKSSRRRTTSCLLSCFGFSDRNDQKYLPEIIVSDDRKKSHRWSFCASCRLKNSVRETIAVYNPPMFKKVDVKKQIKEVKFADKVTGKRQMTVSMDRKPSRFASIAAAVSDQTQGGEEKLKKEKYGTQHDKIHKLKTDTCHKKMTDIRRTTTVTKACSQPDSPVRKSSQEITASLPRTDRPKSTLSVGHFPVVGQKFGGVNDINFGPVIGMSVLIVALVIMLLWGRIPAILGTAAWLYFVYYFKTKVIKPKKRIKTNRSNPVDMDFDSKEYKKKVILDGLLDRKHQRSFK